MHNSEIIERLCNEAAKTTPHIYKKIIQSAKSQGLLSSGVNGAVPSAGSVRTAKTAKTSIGAGGGKAVKAVKAVASPAKKFLIAASTIFLTAAVAVTAVAIPIAYNSNNGQGGGDEITTPDNTANGPETPINPADPGNTTPPANPADPGNTTPPANPADPGNTTPPANPADPGNTTPPITSEPITPENPAPEPEDPEPEEEVIENPENVTEGFRFELNDDGKSYSLVTETGYGYWDKVKPVNPGELIIPALYNGKPVTAIQGKASTVGLTFAKSLTIPKTVKTIGENAFVNFSGIKEINLPDTLTEIGKDAFRGTGYYNDRSNWDNGVLYIGKYLVNAQPSWTILNGGSATKEILKVPDTYTIKEGTRLIADGAFESWDSPDPITVKNITFPEGLEYIGNNAFERCHKLTEINLPDSVKIIGKEAFLLCDGATKLKMSSSVEYISAGAFKMCFRLAGDLNFSDSLTYIGDEAFNGANITSVSLSDNVKFIGKAAFAGCKLNAINLGKGVQYIGEQAFFGYLQDVTSIVIPASVRIIGPNALYSYNQTAELIFEDPDDWTRGPTDFEASRGVNSHGNKSDYDIMKYGEDFYNLLNDFYGESPKDENGDPVPGYEDYKFLGCLMVYDLNSLDNPVYATQNYKNYSNAYWFKGFWH